MPMELLFAVAQSKLPMTIETACEVDKLRVLVAAQLVEAQLPGVGASEQKTRVLAISPQGRAALSKTYPHHKFPCFSPVPVEGIHAPVWLPAADSCHMERDGNKTTLNS